MEVLSETLVNQPHFQEKLVREALRFVEHNFTGFTYAPQTGGFAAHRTVVTCTRFATRKVKSSGAAIDIELDLELDVHNGTGFHFMAIARAPVSFRADIDYLQLRAGERRIVLVTLASVRLPNTSQVSFGRHPDDRVGLSDDVTRMLHQAFAETLESKVSSGFAFYWEAGRGSVFVTGATRPNGHPRRAIDVDSDAEVRQRFAAIDSSQLVSPFELWPVGGAVPYRVRFTAGVVPLIGLDPDALTRLGSVFNGAGAFQESHLTGHKCDLQRRGGQQQIIR